MLDDVYTLKSNFLFSTTFSISNLLSLWRYLFIDLGIYFTTYNVVCFLNENRGESTKKILCELTSLRHWVFITRNGYCTKFSTKTYHMSRKWEFQISKQFAGTLVQSLWISYLYSKTFLQLLPLAKRCTR